MKTLVFACTAGALLASAVPAYAQITGTDEFGSYTGRAGHVQYESPQNAAFELRFGSTDAHLADCRQRMRAA